MLDGFLEVLRKVRERAQKYRAELEKSEALTRYTLIDPVLRALGWDTQDPECVQPEFSTETGKPDYALLWQGKPLIMVEAKALHANLGPAKDKGFQYCWKNKVRYFAITDGERWEVYDMEKMGGEEIAVASISENLGHAARQLLALWRPAMPKVTLPPELVISFLPEALEKPVLTASLVSKTKELTLDELLAKIERKDLPKGSKPPELLRFPDGQTKPIKYWKDLFFASVDWLIERKSIPVPLLFPSTQKPILAKSPEGMHAPKKVRSYFVANPNTIIALKYLKAVLEAAGMDPKEFRVGLRD
ncbi:hypothetical protein H5T57_01390 [Candidatus Bipolaricaulota bacterium]|nr:hypothetical protein [Candidatus Bipolaricaulota bacterium]